MGGWKEGVGIVERTWGVVSARVCGGTGKGNGDGDGCTDEESGGEAIVEAVMPCASEIIEALGGCE